MISHGATLYIFLQLIQRYATDLEPLRPVGYIVLLYDASTKINLIG